MKSNHSLSSNRPTIPWVAATALAITLLNSAALAQTTEQTSGKAMPASITPTPPKAEANGVMLTQEQINAIPFQVLPEKEAVLSSQMMARVESIAVKLGDSVEQGATLVVFDCKELQARRSSSIAELVAAQETHTSKLRLQGLGAAGELEVSLAASAVDRTMSNVGQIDAQIINCKLVAPFSGSISKLRVKEQEVVAPNQAVLDIVDTKNLKLQLFVPAAMSNQINTETMFSVQINDETRQRRARVSRINPRIDGASQVLEIEAVLAETVAGIKPGMLGNAKLIPSRKSRPRNTNIQEPTVSSPKK